MNDLAREKLIEAAMNGTPQITRSFKTDLGLCALGVLGYNYAQSYHQQMTLDLLYELNANAKCPFLGTDEDVFDCHSSMFTERHVVAHLNDIHKMTFLDIARKL